VTKEQISTTNNTKQPWCNLITEQLFVNNLGSDLCCKNLKETASQQIFRPSPLNNGLFENSKHLRTKFDRDTNFRLKIRRHQKTIGLGG
ncbi:hypothetical protein, partial [Vibrio harveyi]|uniref:hypothetical protein n=1 Tax=Vibrio harveyi TaxID=669 RepID=UPI001E35657A